VDEPTWTATDFKHIRCLCYSHQLKPIHGNINFPSGPARGRHWTSSWGTSTNIRLALRSRAAPHPLQKSWKLEVWVLFKISFMDELLLVFAWLTLKPQLHFISWRSSWILKAHVKVAVHKNSAASSSLCRIQLLLLWGWRVGASTSPVFYRHVSLLVHQCFRWFDASRLQIAELVVKHLSVEECPEY